jgi:hypothetical protein
MQTHLDSKEKASLLRGVENNATANLLRRGPDVSVLALCAVYQLTEAGKGDGGGELVGE